MPRITINSDPYEFDLFCPYCGKQILGCGDEPFADRCDHSICVGFDDDGENDIVDSDVVFVAYEGGPADRNHVFAFREPS